MPKSMNQKGKLLSLQNILRRETDEEHPLTLEEIRERLAAQDIAAERKSLYDDFEILRQYGDDVLSRRDRTVRYYIGQRDFDLPELRLLVDAVQSSKFITESKSATLIKKLENLCSRYQAGQLQRQVLVAGRVKTMNESIYYAVDTLQNAMADDRKVTFRYFKWNVKKEKELRHDGSLYTVSPWMLVWNDENYYLVAYDSATKIIRHYRVDRMLQVEQTDDPREGQAAYEELDAAVYTRKTFDMHRGEEETVTLRCADWMAGVIIDRFGKDVPFFPEDEGFFRVHVPVAISEAFFAWLSGFGKDLTVVAPAAVVTRYREYLTNILAAYAGE